MLVPARLLFALFGAADASIFLPLVKATCICSSLHFH
jgi:hypothetical protein